MIRYVALALALLLPGVACAQGVSRQGTWQSSDTGDSAAVVNVQSAPYNAVGDGVADDTAAIQAALDSGAGQPITVYFPPGTYKVAPRDAPTMDLAVGHCLYINYDNIHLLGDGSQSSVIKAYVRGGLDPLTNWDTSPLVGVWRGSTIYMTRPAGNAVRRNIEIKGLRLTGQTPRSSSAYASLDQPAPFPPDPVTGDGWGGYHSAIMFAGSMYCDHFWVSDCELDSYRAEIVISQGATYAQTNVRFDRSYIHDSLGNGLNMAANQVIADCEITQCTQAVECYHYNADVVIERNYIHDNAKSVVDGGNIAINPATYGLFLVRDNKFTRQHVGGIYVLGFTSRVTIANNDFIDEGYNGYGSVLTGTLYGASPSDVLVVGNRFTVDQRTTNSAVNINSDLGYPTKQIEVRGNSWHRTAYARAHAYYFNNGLKTQLYNAADDVLLADNSMGDAAPTDLVGANALWLVGSTADTLAPTVPLYQQTSVRLAPEAARAFTDWTGMPERESVAVEVNENVTIQQSATISLVGGASFAPGGTGGVLTLYRPSGSTIAYEVSRRTY